MIIVNYQSRVSLVKEAHDFIREKLSLSEMAVTIDATVGNGHDTVFLAEHVGRHGTVYGFDIQQIALESTRAQLKLAGVIDRVKLFHAGHELIPEYVPAKHRGQIDSVMFNLGYLPGNDKAIITKADLTILALNAAIQILSAAGGISIITYQGHPGGREETEEVKNWCRQLDNTRFDIRMTFLSEQETTAPCLFRISSKTADQ